MMETMRRVQVVKHQSASARLEFYEEDRAIWVSHVFAKERRQGHARGLLREICVLADALGYQLELKVGQYGHPIGPGNRQLAAFYSQFGFQSWAPYDERIMIRKIYGPYNEPHTFN